MTLIASVLGSTEHHYVAPPWLQKRGLSNFGLIVDAYVKPLLNDPGLLDGASSSIKEAREAALADPEGEALKMVLADNGQREDALAAE